jgi:unsaturated rhamnogalacturonyl hydrolase
MVALSAGSYLTSVSASSADTTPPVVTCSTGDASVLWPPNHRLQTVTLSISASDDSGVAPKVNVRVFSNEEDPEHDDATTHSFSAGQSPVWVRRERLSEGDGRVYLFHLRATDAAGNVGFGACTAVVPHDMSWASKSAVRAQAAAAVAHATAAGSALTPYPTGSLANSAPTAVADLFSTDEDVEVIGSVMANDWDVESEPLTASVSSTTTHGSLQFQSDGSFVYLPDPNYFGSDGFIYKVSDGTSDSNEVAVSLVIRREIPDQFVAAGGDDADETANGVVTLTTFTPIVGKGFNHAFRFLGLPIPKGATIMSANLQLFATRKGATGTLPGDKPISLRYSAEAVGHSAQFTTVPFGLTSRPRTTHYVDHTPAPWVDNTYNPGPDITAIVQEIVSRPDWTPGGAMTFFVFDNGSPDVRTTWSFEAGTTYTPKLVVKFSGGAASTPPLTANVATTVADSIITTYPDPTTIWAGWKYDAGIVFHGMRKIYEKVPDPRYLAYIRSWVDTYVQPDGTLLWETAVFNLDFIQPALLLEFLYQETGLEKYKIASDTVYNRLKIWPRNAEGGFMHNSRRAVNEMILDGIYMAEPFIVRYGKDFGDSTWAFDTAYFQTSLLTQHAYNPTTDLLYHGWDQDKNAPYADPVTGLSPEYWGRGMGWYSMALVDMLDDMPADHPGRAWMHERLQLVLSGLAQTQDPVTGLWYQVPDKGHLRDNWRETSGSAMIVYAMKKSVAKGYVSSDYLYNAEKGWQGILAHSLLVDPEGLPVITGGVLGMGAQPSYADYVNKARLNNSTHSFCAIQLAAVAMEYY